MAPTTVDTLDKRQYGGYGYGGYGGGYGRGGLGSGGRIGVGVGAAVAFALLILLIGCCIMKRRKSRKSSQAITPAYNTNTQPTQEYNQGYNTQEGYNQHGSNANYYGGAAPQQEHQMTSNEYGGGVTQGYPPASSQNHYNPPSGPPPSGTEGNYPAPTMPLPSYQEAGKK